MSLSYENKMVRTVIKDNEIWFVAKDICDILELSNPTMALSNLDDDERAKFNLGRQGETNIINEFGLYNLILGSRKAEAKAFKRWVTHEVLPAIRKDGCYVAKEKSKPALEYQGKVIMVESLMNERAVLLDMTREVIKQVRILEKRVCELEDCSGAGENQRFILAQRIAMSVRA